MESKLSVQKEDTVKNRLEELRKMRGVKQEELAAALEVSRQTIGSLENGRYNPSILLAFKIARYFDTSIDSVQSKGCSRYFPVQNNFRDVPYGPVSERNVR